MATSPLFARRYTSEAGVSDFSSHEPIMCVVIAMANPRPVKKKRISKFLVLLLMLALAGGSYFIWKELQSGGLPAGFASGNGRIEATEVDMATKQEGRVEAVLVREGDMVEPGQVLARMDAAVLEAQLHQAEAEKRRAEEERNVAVAIAAQRENEHALAKKKPRAFAAAREGEGDQPATVRYRCDDGTGRERHLGGCQGAGSNR